jgi:hypothetical protein
MEENKTAASNVAAAEDPIVEFKLIKDRIVCSIVNPEIDKPLIEISGYDLMINFNMEYINSVEDVEAAVQGVADLFRDRIMHQLLGNSKQNA